MKEMDYELRIQGLIETTSSYKSGSGLLTDQLHFAVATGELEHVRFLVEKKHCNPMDRHQHGFTAHMTSLRY